MTYETTTQRKETMFLAANEHGNQFVKDLQGRPVWFSTWNRNEAHAFDSREQAQEYVDGQFRGRGRVIAVAGELLETEGTGITRAAPHGRGRRVKDINDEYGWDEIR